MGASPPLLYITTSINPLQLGLGSGEENNPAARSLGSAQINGPRAGRAAQLPARGALAAWVCWPGAPLALLKKPFGPPGGCMWARTAGCRGLSASLAMPGGQLGLPAGSGFAPQSKQSHGWWLCHGHMCLGGAGPPQPGVCSLAGCCRQGQGLLPAQGTRVQAGGVATTV